MSFVVERNKSFELSSDFSVVGYFMPEHIHTYLFLFVMWVPEHIHALNFLSINFLSW